MLRKYLRWARLRRSQTFVLVFTCSLIIIAGIWQTPKLVPNSATTIEPLLTPELLATTLGPFWKQKLLPTEAELTLHQEALSVHINYAIDQDLQKYVESELRKWRPDHAAFVAMDPTTGRILALASYQRNDDASLGHLALRATYPAASVFKVVTATAAIEHGQLNERSGIPFTGSYHTLYRRNVLKEAHGRWARTMTLKEAFAKSVNSVFGKLGVFHLGQQALKSFAERFMFNQTLQADFPVDMGSGEFEDDDNWLLAELASGFTKGTTLNPVQGAMIAAAVINDGVMMTPFLVDSLEDNAGNVLYRATPTIASVAMSESTAQRVRELMRETVATGTSARAFRPFRRRSLLNNVDVGGKTGSLTGTNPPGKYDWYVGYARLDNNAVAVAALTINEEKWRVKSASLASEFITNYFQKKIGLPETKIRRHAQERVPRVKH